MLAKPTLVVAGSAVLAGCAHPISTNCFAPTRDTQTLLVGQRVDAWHRAAATGDYATYFSFMTDDAVFLGTDKNERWVGVDFREFASPYFKGPTDYGQGAWTYEPVERHVYLSEDCKTAWWDESLRHATYGACRGTGVAIDTNEGWKIAHYSLTFPVPNEIAGDVVEQIQAFEATQGDTSEE